MTNQNGNLFSKQWLERVFLYMWVGGLIVGLIHFWGLMDSFTEIGLADAIFNSAIGFLTLISWSLLKKNNKNVLFLFALEYLIILIYSPIIGRGFNYILFVIGGFLLWRLAALWKEGELEKETR